MVKINVGSGPSSARGWKNYDWGLLPVLGKYRCLSIFTKLSLLPKSYDLKWAKLELMDIRKKWKMANLSVDIVFCSQVLEHFDPDEGEKIVKEMYRVLKKGGKLRLSVPDLEKIAKNYLNEHEGEDINEVIWGYRKRDYQGFTGTIKKFFIRGHQWFYDKESVKGLLERNGFKKVKFYSRAKGSIPDLEKLEALEHQKTSLYLEATKLA